MANYCCTSRTNYFRVTDEEKYEKITSGLSSEGGFLDFTKEVDGITYHGFGSYSDFEYFDEEDPDHDPDYPDSNFDAFLNKMQEILPEDEAFIYMSAGNERLRYVTGYVVVCTKVEIRSMDFHSAALTMAKEMLGDKFTTQLDY